MENETYKKKIKKGNNMQHKTSLPYLAGPSSTGECEGRLAITLSKC
jgi:hypothetical protein